jgi:hypothetical protein
MAIIITAKQRQSPQLVLRKLRAKSRSRMKKGIQKMERNMTIKTILKIMNTALNFMGYLLGTLMYALSIDRYFPVLSVEIRSDQVNRYRKQA